MLFFQQDDHAIMGYLQGRLLRAGQDLISETGEAETWVVGTEPGRLLQPTPLPRQVIMLSSAAVYGEGDFLCGDCGRMPNRKRLPDKIGVFRWDLMCPICGEVMLPLPLEETMPPNPLTPWGQDVLNAENRWRAWGEANQVAVVVLRLFSPYWPDQGFLKQLAAPRLAAWTQSLLHQKEFEIEEDGNSLRDITYGPDVVRAVGKIAANSRHVPAGVYHIASGQSLPLFHIAALLQEALHRTEVPYRITDQHRPGRVRHRVASIRKSRETFGYQPAYDIPAGLDDYGTMLRQSYLQASS